MTASEIKTADHAEVIPPLGGWSAPWSIPGPEKEAWKNQGNHYDYRDLRASRPFDLKITISGPRQFTGV
jgi:hypothetical protein